MSSRKRFEGTLEEIREAGLYKTERIITTPQGVSIKVQDGSEVLNFCANNYLGLADNPEVIAAAHKALDDHGFGLASVRFICGTQDLHKQLEQIHFPVSSAPADTILYTPPASMPMAASSRPLLGPEDAVISDALNHASIIDGMSACARRKAPSLPQQRHVGPGADTASDPRTCRSRLIATDGAFSMDGYIAKAR